MKNLLLASVAMVAVRAHMSDTCDVVTIKGDDGHPVRVNKADYDADQAEGGAKSMTLHADEKKGNTEQTTGAGVVLPVPDNVIIPPAPSAPSFEPAPTAEGQKDQPAGAPVPPTIPAPNALLVAKKGTEKKPKFFVVDNAGADIKDRDGIENDGYDTEQAAWDAILAQPH